jgi:hypothetical protein
MKHTLSVLGLTAGAVLALASGAAAQSPAPATDKFYVNVNIGGQIADRTLNTDVAMPLYDETATLTAEQKIGDGAVFDFGGGYRIYNDVHVGLTFTRFSNTQEATYTASVPNPVSFLIPARVTSGVVPDLKRTEFGIDPHVLWVTPLMDKLDASVALGIAIIHVSQDSLSNFSVPPGTQDVVLEATSESKTGAGLFAGVDFLYALTERFGAGFYLRYAGAEVTFDRGAKSKAGGFQFGGGVRVHF